MPSCDDIILMAAYNATMNQQVYGAAATLPPAELTADRKAFFGSIIGTLNHLIAGDTFWLKRFAEHPARYTALEAMESIPLPQGLTHQLSTDLAELLRYRVKLDQIITLWAAQVRAADLDQLLRYTNSRGLQQKHFGGVVQHFFNHQTHHRGQVSTLLSQAGVDIGITDLLNLIPNQGL
jgi:uncharacterized damage-inducible protein DinB